MKSYFSEIHAVGEENPTLKMNEDIPKDSILCFYDMGFYIRNEYDSFISVYFNSSGVYVSFTCPIKECIGEVIPARKGSTLVLTQT